MVKSFIHSGREFHLGRNKPTKPRRLLRMGDYLLGANLPAPPSSYDYTNPDLQSLKQVYMNNRLGCCVISGMCHVIGVTTGNAGNEVLFSDADVVKMYSAVGGYVPGDSSTDRGCDEHTALDYLTRTGATNGDKAAGWVTVDANNFDQVKTVLWLFENLFFAIQLPDAWVTSQMPRGDGFVWDLAGPPDPYNGHCITGFGYNDRGIKIETWGMVGILTWAALARYCVPRSGGELYTILLQNMIAKSKNIAPNGFDWPTLVTDLDSLGGNAPMPDPVPVPPGPAPDPTPVPDVWQGLLDWITSQLKQWGPFALPVIESWVSVLPLPGVVIAAIDKLLEQFLGRKHPMTYKRCDSSV